MDELYGVIRNIRAVLRERPRPNAVKPAELPCTSPEEVKGLENVSPEKYEEIVSIEMYLKSFPTVLVIYHCNIIYYSTFYSSPTS